MKFTVTLHLLPVTEEGGLDNLEGAIKEALEHISCVYKAEVEPEPKPDKGIGEQ